MTDPTHDARKDIRRHQEMLAACAFILVSAVLLQVRPDHRVAFRGLAGFPLPPACFSRTWLGVKCPGCGLTRSLIHFVHGDWAASYHDHRLGWLMAAAILIQFPYRLASLRRPGRPLVGSVVPKVFSAILIALLLGNWTRERWSESHNDVGRGAPTALRSR